MCAMKYIVLALFLDAVASSPYNIPRYYQNGEQEIQRRDLEADIPRSLSSYMSPLPTVKDSVNEDIMLQPRNLKDPRSPNDDVNVREISRSIDDEQFAQLPSNVAFSTSSYANPSTLNGNELLRHLIQQNRPANNIVESAAPPSDVQIRNGIHSERYNRNPFSQLPQSDSIRPEVINRNNKYQQPLPIQAAPEQRIAFQTPTLQDIPNLDSYRPAIPVRSFDVGKEWSNIARDPPKLPDFIAQRIRNPGNFQRNQMNIGQQVRKPLNAEVAGQKYDVQKILANERIQSVLSSTKQIKRYLVIHPNGTVEHVDKLEPIASRNPNYVLVNAGHVVPGKPKIDVNESKAQVPAPTVEPISSSKVPVISEPQIPDPFVKQNKKSNKATSKKVDKQTEGPKITSTEEFTPSSEVPVSSESKDDSSTTKTADIQEKESTEIKGNPEPEDSEKSQSNNNEDKSITDNNVTSERGADNSEANKDESDSIADVEESSSLVSELNTATEELNDETEKNTEENTAVLSKSYDDSKLAVDQNEENADDIIGEDVESNRRSKPMVYYTSDPDFWTKVTDGNPKNFIYFFQVQPTRVEKDTQRTVYPDGSILEVLTETVWDEEGAEPKVTKTSKFIHPEDL